MPWPMVIDIAINSPRQQDLDKYTHHKHKDNVKKTLIFYGKA